MERLRSFLKGEAIFLNEPMSRHTSFKIGGPADIFLEIEDFKDLKSTLDLCKAEGLPVFILGNGSNLLVSDEGLRCVVIHPAGNLAKAEVRGNIIQAGAGLSLAELSVFAAENELSGLEFAGGIPGTVGGGIYMNAGAYGGELKDTVSRVYIYADGELKQFSAAEMEFSYRHSILGSLKEAVVVAGEFELKPDKKEDIYARIQELNGRRREKQPLEYPSAGSTFKRPETGFAAKLIEEAGLKGKSVGGAEVSVKHSGFIINKGNATAKDVKELIAYIQQEVEKKSGVKLYPEVRML